MRLLPLRRKPVAAPLPAHVAYRWDLDKTYLKSEFGTLREMVKIPFERAEDKIAAPGVAALMRGLHETAERRGIESRVYFISASPPQIGREIRKKLELDGIHYDGIVFKDQLQRIMRGKFRHLREQVGYKLTELLQLRRGDAPEVREYLFGDDWESDPLIYSLYADVVAGRVEAEELSEILTLLRVDPPLVAQATQLAREIARVEAVAKIFINLERRTPPTSFHGYGSRLVPAFNYLQTASCLYEERVLDAAGVLQVVDSLQKQSSYSAERIVNSLADVERRGRIRAETALELRGILQREGYLPVKSAARRRRWLEWWEKARAWIAAARAAPLAGDPPRVDYRAILGGKQGGEAEGS
jgi:hypothetical protein